MNDRPAISLILVSVGALLYFFMMGFLFNLVFPIVENPLIVANIEGVAHPLFAGKIPALLFFWILCFWHLTLVLEFFGLRAAATLLIFSNVAWIFLGATFNLLSYLLPPAAITTVLPASTSFLGNSNFLNFQIYILNLFIAILVLGITRHYCKRRYQFLRLVGGILLTTWLLSFPTLSNPESFTPFIQAFVIQIALIPFWYTAEACLRLIGGATLQPPAPEPKPEKPRIFGPRDLLEAEVAVPEPEPVVEPPKSPFKR